MARDDGGGLGFTLIEMLFVLAIGGTVMAIAVPQTLRALDDFRARAAAQYLAHRIGGARFQAIKRSTSHALRFEAAGSDYRFSLVSDGNGNGLRTSEITSGVDRTLSEPEMLAAHFSGISFGILDGVPDADGNASGGPDGVRVGSARLLSLDPDGTATSGTLYVHGSGSSQYAVRVLGTTGRVRLLRYDPPRRRWLDLS